MPGRGSQEKQKSAPTGTERVLSEPRVLRFREEDMRKESEEYDTEERETACWEMENEWTETTEGEGSGKGAADESTTTTAVTVEEDKEKEGEQSRNEYRRGLAC